MKQNRFCTAANKTAEICKRDFGSTSLRSYHRLFFPRYLFPSCSFRGSRARGLLIWPSSVTFLFKGARLQSATRRWSPTDRIKQCNSLHVAQDWRRGTCLDSCWNPAAGQTCKTKALNVLKYYTKRHMGQRDLSKWARMIERERETYV